MATDDPRPEPDIAELRSPDSARTDGDVFENDEDEAFEIAEDLRIARERLPLLEAEGTVSWESVKARHGL